MNIFKTTTTNLFGILDMYASLALKEAAEKVIEEKMRSYRDLLTKAIYSEAEKIAIKFHEEMYADQSGKGIKIIIDDRRVDTKR